MKNKLIGTDPEITQILELVDKNLKIVIITIYHMFKKVEERLSILTMIHCIILTGDQPLWGKNDSNELEVITIGTV